MVWRSPPDDDKPKSRGAQHLKLAPFIDESLVGSAVYIMRWEKFGWQLGRITAKITAAQPRLFAKFNYRIVWADKTKGPAKLAVNNYAFGEHAAYSSWVILAPAE